MNLSKEILDKKIQIEEKFECLEVLDDFKKEKCFEEIKKLIEDVEDEEDLYGYFKYMYHHKIYLYYLSIEKNNEAKKHSDISFRYLKYSKLIAQASQTNFNQPIDEQDHFEKNMRIFTEQFLKAGQKLEVPMINEINLKKFKTAVDDFVKYQPETFDDYLQLNSKMASIQSLFDDIDLHLQVLNSKDSNHEEMETILEYLKEYPSNKMLISKRINFMNKALEAHNEFLILCNVEMNFDPINKHFKKLSLHFHPDKIKNWLPNIYLNLANEFYFYISDLKDKLLKKYDNSNFNEKMETAYKYWQMAKDYNKILERQFDQIEIIDKNEINLSEKIVIEKHKECLKNAISDYKVALKHSHETNNIKGQLEIRGYISLLLYASKEDFLVSQLYALSALRLVMKNSNLLTDKDINVAKRIYDKVTGAIVAENTQKNTKQNRNQDLVLLNQNNTISTLGYIGSSGTILNTIFPFDKRVAIDDSISDELTKNLSKLIIKSDREIVQYQTSREEILISKSQGVRHKVAGALLLGTGSGVGATALGGAVLSGITAGTAIAFGPIAWIGFGACFLATGLFAGTNLIKKGNQLLQEPKIREELNKILQAAFGFFDKQMYQEFLNELSKEYTTNKCLVKLNDLNDSIDTKQIISTLLNHGFRPDGIAYLLNSIGEALISGKNLNLENFTSGDLQNLALGMFTATMDEKLGTEAKKLDEIVTELRLKKIGLIKKNFNTFKEIYQKRNYTSIAKEHLNDSKNMTFHFRLEELRNIACINKVILRLLKNQEDEINQAEKIIKEVRKSVDENYQFVGKASLRLEALEDFFWILTGKNIEVKKARTENIRQEILYNIDVEYINNLLANTKDPKKKMTLYKQKAVYFREQATSLEKKNHIESLKNWKEAMINYEEAISLDKLDIEACIGHAKCLIKLSKYRNAIDFLSKNSKLLGDEPEFWLISSIAYRKIKKNNEALDSITQALAITKTKNVKELELQKTILKRLDQSSVEIKLKTFKETEILKSEEWFLKKQNSEKKYRILSIDGGGVRGVIPAFWLCEIEKQTKRPISHLFNMISGTSTGSIIAASLSLPKKEILYIGERHYQSTFSRSTPNYSALNILNLFQQHSKNIFSAGEKSFIDSIFGTYLLSDKYSVKGRYDCFKNNFFDSTLKDSLTDLVIPAVNQYDMSNTYLFNRFDAKIDSTKNESLLNAVMASTAAPTFFPIYEIKNKGHFLDGGIHLNNPTNAAYNEALRYEINRENISVLSMGTGSYIPDPFDPNICQGQLFWAKNFHKVALESQESNVDNAMYEKLNNRYDRWQVSFAEPMALDEFEKMNYLLESANEFIEELYVSDDNKLNNLIENLTKDDF